MENIIFIVAISYTHVADLMKEVNKAIDGYQKSDYSVEVQYVWANGAYTAFLTIRHK